jgi:hypothetical protein
MLITLTQSFHAIYKCQIIILYPINMYENYMFIQKEKELWKKNTVWAQWVLRWMSEGLGPCSLTQPTHEITLNIWKTLKTTGSWFPLPAGPSIVFWSGSWIMCVHACVCMHTMCVWARLRVWMSQVVVMAAMANPGDFLLKAGATALYLLWMSV